MVDVTTKSNQRGSIYFYLFLLSKAINLTKEALSFHVRPIFPTILIWLLDDQKWILKLC